MICCSNGICLCLSLFTVCYLQNAVSKRQPLYIDGNNLNRSQDIGEQSPTNKRNFRLPNAFRPHDAFIKTTTFVESVTSRIDNRRNVRTTSRYSHNSKSVNYDQRTTSVYNDHYVSTNVKERRTTNIFWPFEDFDVAVGVTYLCQSQHDCDRFLNNTFCESRPVATGIGSCKCTINYVYNGEKCIKKEDVDFCESHRDCNILGNRRCSYVSSIKTKICLCEKNYVADGRKCLWKVGYLDYCLSSNQCPMGTTCLKNICRPSCASGYIWNIDRCVTVSDLPKINPRNESTSVDPYVVISIIGGIAIVSLFLTVGLLVRRRLLLLRRNTSPPDNYPHYSSPESSAPTFRLEPDQPPSYEELMTVSTMTLATNAQELSEDPPPSYKYWEQDFRHK